MVKCCVECDVRERLALAPFRGGRGRTARARNNPRNTTKTIDTAPALRPHARAKMTGTYARQTNVKLNST